MQTLNLFQLLIILGKVKTKRNPFALIKDRARYVTLDVPVKLIIKMDNWNYSFCIAFNAFKFEEHHTYRSRNRRFGIRYNSNFSPSRQNIQ